MRFVPLKRFVALFIALVACAIESSDPELNQLDLELRTYAPANDWITPYASNGPFCCPITQLAISGDNLLAVTSGGYWISSNGDNWNVINRLPPDMLATTQDGIFIVVPGNGLMETAGAGQFSPIRSPQGGPVTDLSEIDNQLFAANASASIFSASESEKIWKRLPLVSQGTQIRSVAAIADNLYAGVGPKGEVYKSTNHGSVWNQAGRLPDDSGQFKRLVSLKDEIYAVTERGLFKPHTDEIWQRALEAPPGASLYSVVDYKGMRYAGTDRGLYRLQQDGSWFLAHPLLSRGPVTQVSYADGVVFASTKNGLFQSNDNGRTWNSSNPLGRDLSINGVVQIAGGREFVASSKGLFTRVGHTSDWMPIGTLPRDAPVSSIRATDRGDIIIVMPPLEGANQPSIYESDDSGQSFRQLPKLPYPSLTLHVAVVDTDVFALPDHGAFLLSKDRQSWKSEDTLAARVVFNIVKRGKNGIAATTPENIFLRPVSSDAWTPLHVQIAGATSAWFDPNHPEVVVAISGNGLSWNSDIFESTRPVQHWISDRPLAFQSVLSICEIPSSPKQPATLLIGTDYGAYLLVDKLNRAGFVARSWRSVAEIWNRDATEPWFWIVSLLASAVTAYLSAVLAIILLAWRGVGNWIGIDWLLSLITSPMRIFPRLMRWVLFFGYRERSLKLAELLEASDRYFGLPATFNGGLTVNPDAEGTGLHNAIAKSLATCNCLLIQGEGGAGKSTVLTRLTSLGLQRRLPGVLKNSLPIYVSSSSYEGDIVQAVSDTLRRRNGLPLDRQGEIVRQQLQAGNILVLFDGVSEIEGDKAKALARMVALVSGKEMQNSWFVFSSRPLRRTPETLPIVRLEPLQLGVIEQVYLPMRANLDPEQRQQVIRQLVSFGTQSIEPLLLTLAINDSLDNTIATTKADLFERYFRRILRVQGERDQIAWQGWKKLIETLADWFILDTGRRGFGLPHRVLVRLMQGGVTSRSLLGTIEAEYGLTFESEISVLEQLASIGILTSDLRWHFRHDSFEAYFAAVRILAGLEEDDPVDLQIWTGPYARDFLPVIEFLGELGSRDVIKMFLKQNAQIPQIWREVLDQKTAYSA